MTQIHVLDEQVAAQIAAGEVIERPVSVVKELIENSLDAGASRIDIELEKGGMGLIRLTDNGSGMSKEDLALAFRRHATSKITDFRDLYELHSFGFRGEALASMLAVSQVQVTSGQSEHEAAWQYRPLTETSGNFQKVAPTLGTTMEVRNLFYNIPARRKFVRSNSHEISRIKELVAMTSLAYPDVTFNVRVDGEWVFQTTNLNSVEERMLLIYGDHLSGHLLSLNAEDLSVGVHMQAWLSDATIHRSNKKDISTFVNGRFIHSPELEQIIMDAYYSYIPDGKFPIVHMRMQLPPETIDVNIHPQKTTIQIHGLSRIRSEMIDQLKDKLWESRLSIPLRRDPMLFENELAQEQAKPLTTSQEPQVAESSLELRKDIAWPKLPSEVREEAQAFGHTNSKDLLPTVSPDNVKGRRDLQGSLRPQNSFAPASIAQADLTELEPIGQLHQTFILAQNEFGLFIVDQHSAHERILYDELKANAAVNDGVMQTLLLPEALDLTPRQEEILYRHMLALRDLGLLIERHGPGKIELLALPPALGQVGNFQSLINEILAHLETRGRVDLPELLEAVISTASCKAAIKARRNLTTEEIKSLFKALSRTEHPHTCPHGRPTVMSVSMTSLYKYFQRGHYESRYQN